MAVMMCVEHTPVVHYPEFGLWVKREDLCCPGGPHFSKTRGVYAHALTRPEKYIGVLDTGHSRGGWAVARACYLLGKTCALYYPVRAADRFKTDLPAYQYQAQSLGAELHDLQAGRSAVLYHRAKRFVEEAGGYMFPNALKLRETVEETKREFLRTALPPVNTILVSASSGTIAAGVIAGARAADWRGEIVVHLGYSRSGVAVRKYIEDMAGLQWLERVEVVDESYAYSDEARPGPTPPWPCDKWYDLKAFRYFCKSGLRDRRVLLWNVG